MNDKNVRVFIGNGMGQISSLTLPFADNLRENGIVTVFAIPKGIPGNEKFFEGSQKLEINLVNRSNESEVLSGYAVKACNDIGELDSAIKQAAAQKDGITHILYPSESLGDITKVPGVEVAGAFSAVGPKPLPIVLRSMNDIAGQTGVKIPFYMLENFSQAKKDALEKPEVYANLKIRNCVIDRTSNGLKIEGNKVTIGTEPAGKCGGIMYESRPGEERFLGRKDGIAFTPLSTKQITEKETVKWVGINLVDYLITRHVAFKALGVNATDDVFAAHPELAPEKIGKYMDAETRQELAGMLGEVHKFLAQYGFQENIDAFTADRIKMMEGDTFGRIIKVPDMPAYLDKKIFCKVESIGRGLIGDSINADKPSLRDLQRALLQKQRTAVKPGKVDLTFKK